MRAFGGEPNDALKKKYHKSIFLLKYLNYFFIQIPIYFLRFFAGQYVKEKKNAKIGRITGLDPAGPLFISANNDQGLSAEDATFVDVIHTDAGKSGTSQVLGHADFYPNGGRAPQPGCTLTDILWTLDIRM